MPLPSLSSQPSQSPRTRTVPLNRTSVSSAAPPPAPPLSAFAAFLAALSWTRARRDPDDFDAGLNASSAWTKERASFVAASNGAASSPSVENVDPSLCSPRMDTMNALSDDESDIEADVSNDSSSLLSPGPDDGPLLSSEPGRPARALYAFDGKLEFRELTGVRAGDRLEVLKEEVGGGWSLVRHFVPVGSENGDEASGEKRILYRRGKGKARSEVGLLPCTYYAVRRPLYVPLSCQDTHLYRG